MAEQKCVPQRTFFGKVKLRHSEGEKSPSGATAGKDRGLGQGLIHRADQLGAQQGTGQREEAARYAVANAF